jgi:hypothetical protein
MDGQQFDRLTQQLTLALTRRRFGAVLAALGLSAGLAMESRAKPKKKKKKKAKGCKNGAVKCGKTCVDTATNAAHCGGCGQACPSGQACAGGACQTGGCSGDREPCGGACVNLDNDEQHCGECGRACAGDLTCLDGDCGCADGTKCGDACVDLDDDDAHCGQCNLACQGELTCLGGDCGCADGTKCGNACVNLQTNRNHCGGCNDACTGNQTCSGGECVDPPECVNQDGCGGFGFNDLVCRDGRCVCATEGEGICHRFPDRRGICDTCCPGGSGQCRFDEVCHVGEVSGVPFAYCDCPTGWQRCNYQPHPTGTCVADPLTDSRKCGPFCEDCTANTDFPAICCGGLCTRGCGGPGTVCFNQDQPCGPNCLPCNSDSICCNMGPGTLPRCIPNAHGNVCYQN